MKTVSPMMNRMVDPAAHSARLSVIVPVFNEADNILPLTREIAASLGGQSMPFELVFVDDGSSDDTGDALVQARGVCPRVRGLRHDRNAGQSAALWTGFQATAGPLLATLDGDLQNDPADLPRLLAGLDPADFVCGVRVHRQDNLLRRLSSQVARASRRAVLRVDFRDTGCALRVFRRAVLQRVFPYHGFHRVLPVLAHAAGFQVCELPVNHRPRRAGVSKYGLWNRLGRGLYDLVGLRWYLARQLPLVPHTEYPLGVTPWRIRGSPTTPPA